MALGSKLQEHLNVGKNVDLKQLGKFKVGFKGIAEAEVSKLSSKKIQKKLFKLTAL